MVESRNSRPQILKTTTSSTSSAMARSPYSPSLSPRSISPSFSESSNEDDESALSEPLAGSYNCSPSGSPAAGDKDKSAKNAEPDAVTCLWDDCGVIFTHLPTLIAHIHDGTFRLSITQGGQY
jgi:hypothetical protein